MHLAEALGVATVDDIDPTRPLRLGPFELGIEATAEAVRILGGEDFPRDVTWLAREFTRPVYWSIAHQTEGAAEVFGFPAGVGAGLPTAIEIAIVRAIAAASLEDHSSILGGGMEISLGPHLACSDFLKIIAVVQEPMAGDSLLFTGSTQAVLGRNIADLLNNIVINCLSNSFRTSPLKFRFLELYRVMEARFLADVKAKLLAGFDAEPGPALGDAIDALKSELNQITGLAETQQDAFEACWTTLHALKNDNRFAAALFRRIEKKGAGSGAKWKTGAALIYQNRCAIVHAGEKDMIFENFPDGEHAIEAVLPQIERAALLLVGIELL
jgi:hypothetical protein